jgi:microfibrillar-associated protein 1
MKVHSPPLLALRTRAFPESEPRAFFEAAFGGMSGRVRADETVRVKGSNPSWLDRDREKRDGAQRAAEVATKVSRHRAGVLPGWAAGAEADEDDRNDEFRNDDARDAAAASSAHPGRRRVAAPAVIISGARAVKPATIVRGKREPAGSEDESTASEEEEDEDDIARRRAAARARLAARRAEEEEGMPVGEEDDDEDFPADAKPRPPKPVASEDEGSSSWETDTDASDSDDDARKMVRPVFVSRAQRETLRARDDETNADADDDEWAAAEAHKKKRAEESRRLVELEIERETAIANAETNAEASDVDTDDDVEDPAVAYAAWRLRELARIEEDEKTRDRMFAEREEQEKIRRMSEEEKRAYFAAHPELRRETEIGGSSSANGKETSKDKPKLGFMQKYYHKGAFFQEAADDAFGTASTHEIYARDFSAATGGDKGVDKSSLPKAMQVRGDKFGKVGQTKWTHLANEDTSRLASERPQNRKTGKEQSFDKPSARRT